MIKVEVTEQSLKDSGYDLVEGDSITVPDKIGQNWCDHGWAKDVSGEYPTGERKVLGTELSVQKLTHTTKTSDPTTPKKKGRK